MINDANLSVEQAVFISRRIIMVGYKVFKVPLISKGRYMSMRYERTRETN